MEATVQAVINAINERRVIEFDYRSPDGDSDEGRRTANPHILGTIDGRPFIEVWQTGGASRRKRLPQWRLFELHGMSEVVVTDRSFDRCPDFNPEGRDWRDVSAVVS